MGPRREGEQIDSYPGDFPFGIMDVVELLHLRIRRRQANSVYVDCPFCGDRRGKMNVNFVKNVWRCNYCDEHGGMLALYARLNNTTTSDAYWEIGEALCNDFHRERPNSGYEMAGNQQAGTGSPVSGTQTDLAGYERRGELKTVQQAERASGQKIHQTLSLLLAMLPLQPAHRNHLHSPKRGLSDEQIDRIGFKSTPPPFLCRSITERLMKQGCKVEGVPGFYLDDSGRWTMNFYRKNAGILIPAVGYDGMIHGLQILLDIPLKQKDDPPDKAGAKYIWFSSSSKNMGVTSGSPVHFIGDPSARVVYVIEGLLKADISHCLTNRTFVAIAGANNTSQLDTLFALLAQNGTEEIIEAHDMDKYSNQMTSNGASKIYLMARKNGMACRRLTWNPNYKGFDDWQLALREKEQKEKEVQRMNFKQQYLCGKCDFTYIDGCVELWHTRAEKDLDLTEYLGLTKEEYQIFLAQGNQALKDILDSQRVFRRFCIYQLCLGETQTVPFAFKQLDALRKAGYEQPPAAAYQTVWSAEVCCPKGQNDMEVLGRLFLDYNEHLPEDYRGRPLAPSDVVELDCQGKRTYFYVNDCRDFAPVTEKNNMHDIDTFMFFKWFFKAWVAVYLVTHTFTITMAVFDMAQHVVSDAAGVIGGNTNIDVDAALSSMQAGLDAMEIPELLLLVMETSLVSLCMKIMSVLITVILYGRMIEIYLYCSVSPIPFATMTNREWGQIGNNYLKALFALGFQGFLIMICVGIYAVLVGSMIVADNLHSAIFSLAAYTVILCFSLFKTGALAKSIFNAH